MPSPVALPAADSPWQAARQKPAKAKEKGSSEGSSMAKKAYSVTNLMVPHLELEGDKQSGGGLKFGHSKVRSSKKKGSAERGTSLPVIKQMTPEAKALWALLSEDKVDIESVEYLLEQHGEVSNAQETSFGWSPLLFAANAGDAQLMSLLLRCSADVHRTCLQGNSALHFAARGGHLHATNFLLAHGTKLEAKNVQGWTPLFWSAIAGQEKVVTMLINAAAKIAAKDRLGRTPCMWAARHGHTSIVCTFLEMGIDVRPCDDDGLDIQAHTEHYVSMRRHLGKRSSALGFAVRRGSDSSLYTPAGATVLDMSGMLQRYGAEYPAGAAKKKRNTRPNHVVLAEAVKAAVAASGRLLTAAKQNQWEIATEALRQGACVAITGEADHRSALAWAAVHNAPEAAMSLVAARAPLEARDCLGWTAVHHATYNGCPEAMGVLHYLCADLAAYTDDGDSPLHLAARADKGNMIRLLHAAALDLEVLDSRGSTPLQDATKRGCDDAFVTLVTLKADVNIQDEKKRSVFALAAMHGHVGLLDTMLKPPAQLPEAWTEEELSAQLDALPWVPVDSFERPISGGQEPTLSMQDKEQTGAGAAAKKKAAGKKQVLKPIREDQADSTFGTPRSGARGLPNRSDARSEASGPATKRTQEGSSMDRLAKGGPHAKSTALGLPGGRGGTKGQKDLQTVDDIAKVADIMASSMTSFYSALSLATKFTGASLSAQASSFGTVAIKGAINAKFESSPLALLAALLPGQPLPILTKPASKQKRKKTKAAASSEEAAGQDAATHSEDSVAPTAANSATDSAAPAADEFSGQAADPHETHPASPDARVGDESVEGEGSEGILRLPADHQANGTGLLAISEDAGEEDDEESQSADEEEAAFACHPAGGPQDLETASADCEEPAAEEETDQQAETGDTPAVLGLEPVAPLSIRKALLQRDEDGRNALHLATQFEQFKVVVMLIERSAEVEVKDKKGFTPLMLAAANGDQATGTFLLEAKARVETTSKDGKTALDVARGGALRELFAQIAHRLEIQKKLTASATSPARRAQPQQRTEEPPKSPRCQIRVDGLPDGLSATQMEKHMRKLLARSGARKPVGVEVARDPISQRPKRRVFVTYRSLADAEDAADCLEDESDEEFAALHVTVDVD
eukprot:TRINITY_DN31930_c0_g1_i1.p1 TRINITY_DN31930_c0_g1~~TRINITY_DN31930_c0_g1_i1.p1  ORF type:complete len:1144 (-),score=284.73 TRINITY_DN31930_c0_g1_i1:160-3591(-)